MEFNATTEGTHRSIQEFTRALAHLEPAELWPSTRAVLLAVSFLFMADLISLLHLNPPLWQPLGQQFSPRKKRKSNSTILSRLEAPKMPLSSGFAPFGQGLGIGGNGSGGGWADAGRDGGLAVVWRVGQNAVVTTKRKTRTAKAARKIDTIESVRLDELLADPANVRLHSERNIDAIMASLVRFGQQKPIVVRRDGLVVAGNGTLEAARRLSWEGLEVRWTGLEGAEAVAYSIADNRTAELAEWDKNALAMALESLPPDARLGWNDEDIEQLGEDDEGDGEGPSTGELLNRLQHVFLDEPLTVVEHGEVWRLGQHVMVVADVVNDVALWLGLLTKGMLFCPYPGPFVALTAKADRETMLLVQPDRYVAGHLLDQYKAQKGERKVTKD